MNSREYRNSLGFTNKGKFIQFISAKDISEPNWSIIEQRNERLIQVFSLINSEQKYPSNVSVKEIVDNTTKIIRDNGILLKLNNHGRAIEDVYYSWLSGYLAEIVFQPLMVEELGLTDLERNGGDDLSDPESFKRTGDADLVSHADKILIDVQAGFSGSRSDIKRHKVDAALRNPEYKSVVFFLNMVDGSYAVVDLKSIQNEEFVPNPRWEGQLCYTVPDDIWKPFV
jgi:hypothetical protein